MSLPASWRETTVGSIVVDLQPGFAQKPGEEGEGTTPQIRTHNVTPEGKISLEGVKHISASTKELKRYALAAGDVVFNNTNSEEWVGKTATFDQVGEYVFSNHMTRLRVHHDLAVPEYLASCLHLLWAVGYSKTRAKRWVSQAGIEGDALASFKLPLPPLLEQQRIVDALRQMETINSLSGHAEDLFSGLGRQRFYEMFGHPAENPNGFETAPLISFGTIDRGVSKHRPRDASHLFGGPYPFIQTGEVSNAGDWITEYKATYSEAGLSQSRLWPRGTLCITIAANIAKAAILDFDACFPDSVVGFTPGPGIHSEYVLYCLRFYQEYFEHRAPKSAQMNINLDTLRSLGIPKPPPEQQRLFADFVKELRELGKIRSTQNERIAALQRELRVAAFTGGLTERWREENASELASAAIARDEILRERGAKLSAPPVTVDSDTVAATTDLSVRPGRHGLLYELSTFQRKVLDAFISYCERTQQQLLAEDAELFARFCNDPETVERLQVFGPAQNNRIRRTLSQLAALGLIAKVTLPKQDLETGKREYLKAFRPLRDDEFTRLTDLSNIRRTLLGQEQHYFLSVQLDYENSERAGAGGMFQVISVEDEGGKDMSDLVDQGRHYASLEDLKRDLARALMVAASNIELEVV